ncbi:hypothetical protein YC2023_014651 [Brassica napus]|uniref:(rape) hypothetical protein n=1 Tax=Brassica napus TaxID=3708 RepID=A0A816JNT2_BRANA|nr:unnamed protein product [Brassica napus]
MIRRDWQQVEQALLGHSLSSSEAASSVRISLDVRILPSKKFFAETQSFLSLFGRSLDEEIIMSFVLYMHKVPLISEYLALECEGKDKYKCGSNVFWKW